MKGKSLIFQITAFVSLIAFIGVTFTGCTKYSWHVIPVSQMKISEETREARLIRFYLDVGFTEMYVREIDFPYIKGWRKDSSNDTIKVDLRKVNRIEVQRADVGKTMIYNTGIAIGIGAAALLVILLIGLASYR